MFKNKNIKTSIEALITKDNLGREKRIYLNKINVNLIPNFYITQIRLDIDPFPKLQKRKREMGKKC